MVFRGLLLGHLCIAQTEVPLEQSKAIPLQACYRPTGFQEDEAPRLLDSQHINVVSLSALWTGHLYPGIYSWYLFLL
jgi:hypothetical protein